MQKDTRLGTFEDVIRRSPPGGAAIARTLRRLIGEVCPQAVEAARPAEPHVRYALGPDKDNQVFGYLCPLHDYVRLGFYFGGSLPDPGQLLEGTGKRLRHVKIYSLAQARRPEVKRLVQAAVRERKRPWDLSRDGPVGRL
jgi:hypothetical protein